MYAIYSPVSLSINLLEVAVDEARRYPAKCSEPSRNGKEREGKGW